MSSYSPVAPIDCLLSMKLNGFLGNYLLLLAHDVVAHENKYRSLLEGFHGTIIMDNSLIELGAPVTTDVMLSAVKITKATYAVLPDKLFDCKETIAASTTAARQWAKAGLDTEVMIVAQGNSVEERLECVASICNSMDFGYIIGVPRALVSKEGSRLPTIEAMERTFGAWQHLLGFSCNYYDDLRCTKMNPVIGIDSATPIRLGHENKMIPGPLYEWDPASDLTVARENFFLECNKFTPHMAYNLGAIHAALGTH